MYVVHDEEFFEVYDEESLVSFAADQAEEITEDYYDSDSIQIAKNLDVYNVETCIDVLKTRNFDVDVI